MLITAYLITLEQKEEIILKRRKRQIMIKLRTEINKIEAYKKHTTRSQ